MIRHRCRLLVAALGFLLLGTPPIGAQGVEAPANQLTLTRSSNYQSTLTWQPPVTPRPPALSWTAGSGTIADECAINFGWLPRGAYDVKAHHTDLAGQIAGVAWELSEHQCYDGTWRTDLLIHSEMTPSLAQDEEWESWSWTFSDPNDYASFGCVKLSYLDALELDQWYRALGGDDIPATLLVE